MEQTCKTCRYCHSLRHDFKKGKGYRRARCCTYLYDTAFIEGAKGDLIIQVKNDSPACEVWQAKCKRGEENE